jgi:O-phospho-L-seryl-tRNASec:L-selenocysteinyl-tRNA synthase
MATIPDHMLKRGLIVLQEVSKPLRVLLEQRRIPKKGIDDDLIRSFFNLLSSMDTDKDPLAARIGEREARVASPYVLELAAGFAHGVGRSGDLSTPQPKAPGGSLLQFFANRLALDAMKRFGLPKIEAASVVPLTTGMTLAMTLAAARNISGKREVVYPRVDHRSPLKAIEFVGMRAKVIDGEVFGDAVRVPTGKIQGAVTAETAAVVSTTTFFPPREPDDVKEIAKIARDLGIFHIVNNAYGVQSRVIMSKLRAAMDAGRVDAVVQSTDKNFLTPVGGSIVCSSHEGFIRKISETYAGRATAAPFAQFLASILSLGEEGYERLRDEQEKNRKRLEELVEDLAQRHRQRLLKVFNPVAVAMTLSGLDARKIGGALYNERVTGPRALEPGDFGVCCERYHSAYLSLNAAIGCREQDIEVAVRKVDGVLSNPPA